MHDDYKPRAYTGELARCPVCGSEAAMWQHSESDKEPIELVVMCSHGDRIGPQDGLMHEGCLLYMPPPDFYCDTMRDAARYWNEFAAALCALRESRASGVQAIHPMRAGYVGSVMSSGLDAHAVVIRYATREQADAAQAWLADGVGASQTDQRQVREDSQGLGEPGRLSPIPSHLQRAQAEVAAWPPERLRDLRLQGSADGVATPVGDLMELVGEFGRCVRDEPTKAGAVLHEIHQRINALGVKVPAPAGHVLSPPDDAMVRQEHAADIASAFADLPDQLRAHPGVKRLYRVAVRAVSDGVKVSRVGPDGWAKLAEARRALEDSDGVEVHRG